MGTVTRWLTSANCYIYCNHFLSAWGARMWLFSVGLFLIRISPESLQLSGIYGLVTGASVLVLAPLIGDWVDKNQRLRAARVTLLIQYVNMIVFATLVCLLVRFHDWAKLLWNGWLLSVWQGAVVLVAVSANLSNIGYRISIQRDWIVEICARDKDQLATMGAVLRRIDLGTKILAPIATGQIMTFASIQIGAIFIASWSFVTMFVEYFLLRKVYKSVPALAVKKTRSRLKDKTVKAEGTQHGTKMVAMATVTSRKDTNDRDVHIDNEAEYTFKSRRDPETWAPDPSNDKEICDIDHFDQANGEKPSMSETDYVPKDSANQGSFSRDETHGSTNKNVINSSSRALPEPETTRPDITSNINGGEIELNTSGEQSITENKSTKTYKSSQDVPTDENKSRPCAPSDEVSDKENGLCNEDGLCYKLFGAFIILFNGWKTYARHHVARAGLGLALLYLTVLGFDNITTAYAFSQGLSESILGFLMAGGALVGIAGTFAFTRIRRKVGLERTGLYSFSAETLCLTLCVASIWTPGSPFDPLHRREGMRNAQNVQPCSIANLTWSPTAETLTVPGERFTEAVDQSDSPTLTSAEATGNGANVTTPLICPDQPIKSFASVALLLTGIITARFGLWITDLTVTQIFLENVVESERGVVNGVQSSLNQMMDMLKFALVVGLPKMELFGILILISFTAVATGGIFYASYCRSVRGHLFHFEKVNCSDVTNSNHPSSGETASQKKDEIQTRI